jgi:hypothetical protein
MTDFKLNLALFVKELILLLLAEQKTEKELQLKLLVMIADVVVLGVI